MRGVTARVAMNIGETLLEDAEERQFRIAVQPAKIREASKVAWISPRAVKPSRYQGIADFNPIYSSIGGQSR